MLICLYLEKWNSHHRNRWIYFRRLYRWFCVSREDASCNFESIFRRSASISTKTLTKSMLDTNCYLPACHFRLPLQVVLTRVGNRYLYLYIEIELLLLSNSADVSTHTNATRRTICATQPNKPWRSTSHPGRYMRAGSRFFCYSVCFGDNWWGMSRLAFQRSSSHA